MHLAIDSGARAASTGAMEEIVTELDLDQARRRAKELLRAARAGDPGALARMRADRPPRLADAQRAVARGLGFQSWAALRRAAAAADGAAAVHETRVSYTPRSPVRIRVRRRGRRYDIDDMGAAVALAGRPPGWLAAAEGAVRALGWNVNRDGVVFVQGFEGRDIERLVRGTAEASVAVFDALLALDDDDGVTGRPGRSS